MCTCTDGKTESIWHILYAVKRWEFIALLGSNHNGHDWVVLFVFQAQLIAQSIGQAFQVAYMEFLKANGIDDPGLIKEMDYQDVLAQQEIFGEELQLFTNKELHKEVSLKHLLDIWENFSFNFCLKEKKNIVI